jgi:hypothetical protein
MAKYTITLDGGQEVQCELLLSEEVDFQQMTWTFTIDTATRVAAGDYIVMHTADYERAIRDRATAGKEVTK